MRILALTLAVCALAFASVSQAAVTALTLTKVQEANVPGHQTFDLTVTGTGQFTGVQMLAELTAGSFYNNDFGGDLPPNSALFGAFPELQFDTFYGLSGKTAATDIDPVVPGGAVNLGGDSAATFTNTKIDLTWAPPGASPVNNANGYFLGRFTIADGSTGSIKLLGLSFQEPDFVAPVVDVATLLGGVVLEGEFASTPADGGVLDFGYGAAQRTVNLAVRNVGDPSTTIEVASATLSDGSLFSLPGFAPLSLTGGAGDTNIVVQFNGIGTPGIYTDTLTLRDGAGDVLGTYTLTAAVPEPSTIALAGLGLVGLVGFLRRRG